MNNEKLKSIRNHIAREITKGKLRKIGTEVVMDAETVLAVLDALLDDSSQSPCDHQCHVSATAADHVNGCDYCKENHSSQSQEEKKCRCWCHTSSPFDTKINCIEGCND